MSKLMLKEGNKVTAIARLSPKRMKRLAINLYTSSPVTRFLLRCGRARKQMRAYREVKMIRRPRRFRQDVW